MGEAQFELALIHYLIVAAYFVGVLALGLYHSRKRGEEADDYFLAGRNLGWFVIGFSLYASNMSGSSFVGLMGGAYENGIATIRSTSRSEFTLTKSLPGLGDGVDIQLEIGDPSIITTTRFDVKNGRLVESVIIVDLTFATTYSFGNYRHRMAQRRRKQTRIELIEVIPPDK